MKKSFVQQLFYVLRLHHPLLGSNYRTVKWTPELKQTAQASPLANGMTAYGLASIAIARTPAQASPERKQSNCATASILFWRQQMSNNISTPSDLTLRDYFAAKTVTWFLDELSLENVQEPEEDFYMTPAVLRKFAAQLSYTMADAMMEARNAA
jgi:hypothetical protein